MYHTRQNDSARRPLRLVVAVIVALVGGKAIGAEPTSGMLGVIPVDQDGQVFVKEVYLGGPAERAGLRPGDRLIEFDGQPINSAADLINLVGTYPPGKRLEIRASREGWVKQISITLGNRNDILRLRHTGVAVAPPAASQAPTSTTRPRGWIDEERAKHINDPYYRAKKTRW